MESFQNFKYWFVLFIKVVGSPCVFHLLADCQLLVFETKDNELDKKERNKTFKEKQRTQFNFEQCFLWKRKFKLKLPVSHRKHIAFEMSQFEKI
jgi:hypothetical protein